MAHQQENSLFRSAIKPELLSRALKRGSWSALGGMLLLLLGGIALPLTWLSLFGIPLFFIGLAAIAFGMRPYRQLTRLQNKPHTLASDGEFLVFAKHGKPLFLIAQDCLEKVRYLEKENIYGWGIWLKHPLTKKIKIFQADFDCKSFMKESQARFEGCDLFLPFFTERSLNIFRDQLE